MDTIPVGNTLHLVANLYDQFDMPLDASNVRLLVLAPGASASTILPVEAGSIVGEVSGDIVASTDGIWYWRFETTSPPYAAKEGEFRATPREVPAP